MTEPNINTPPVTPSPSQVLAVFTMVVTELVNDAIIDGHWAKIVTGLAGILVPFAWIMADAIIHHASAKIEAAKVLSAPNNGVTNVQV